MNLVAGRWGVASTIRARAEYVADFVRHYLDLGAAEIFLFLDDPATAATAPVDRDPRIKTIVCDADFWRSGRPAKLNDRQLANLRHALSNAGVGWMLNADLDERVSCQAFLSEMLEGVKSDVLSISLPPMEAVYDAFPSVSSAFRTPWFKPVLAEREASQSGANAILFEMHGDLARLTRHGLFGHIRGKYLVRTGVPDIDLRLHAVVSPDPAAITGLRIAGLELLHFDTLTFEDWREKWGLRVSGDVICKMSDTRLLQFSLIKAAFGAADEAALRRIYADMSVVSAETLGKAVDLGVVVRRIPAGLPADTNVYAP